MEEREVWHVRDPAQLLGEIAEESGLPEGTAWLVQVEDPATRQRVVRIDQLSHGAPEDWWPADAEPEENREVWRPACLELREQVDRWDVPDTVPPRHVGLIITVRRGLCVFGSSEFDWLLAWRYINHCKRLFSGLILVTEHGWVDFDTKRGAATPALAA